MIFKKITSGKNPQVIEKKEQKRWRFKPYFLLVILIFSLAVAQIIFANKQTTSGKVLQKLEQEVTVLEGENRQLELEIISQASLESLKEKAEKLGFIDEISVTNLTSQKEVALKY